MVHKETQGFPEKFNYYIIVCCFIPLIVNIVFSFSIQHQIFTSISADAF